MTICAGSFFSNKASLLVMTVLLSRGKEGRDFGVAPVAITIFLQGISFFSVTFFSEIIIVFLSNISALPLI